MVTERIKYKSSNDTNMISACIFRPRDENIKGIIQISHGMCEYMDKYTEFARYMTLKGYAICGNDHLGHGETACTADQYGWFGDSEGIFYLVHDMKRLNNIVKERFNHVPCHFLGHSMGSFITRLYANWYKKDIASCILCGTSGSNPLLNVGLKIITHELKLNGSKGKIEFLNKLATEKTDNDMIALKRVIYGIINSNSFANDKFRADPKCNFIFTNGGFKDLFEMLNRVSRDEWFENVNKDMPILLISGELDPVGGYGRGVLEVYEKLKTKGVKKVDIKLYRGMRHEILNEKNRLSVFSDIEKWISSLNKKADGI